MEKINPAIEASWAMAMHDEFEKPYFNSLKKFLLQEKSSWPVYPPGSMIFEAFNRTPFDRVKVVLLGQDPYHGQGQAHGLCFSVADGVALPPSLINIFAELKADLGVKTPANGNLSAWADQGVLLLNATLTVRADQAGSHQGKGWELFTDAVIKKISDERNNVVFLLWGKFAQNKRNLINTNKHYIIEAPHPSPLSAYRGFLGCKAFSKTNQLLLQSGISPVDWSL